jgi:hypothetical protein
MGHLTEQWHDELLEVRGKFPLLDDLAIHYGLWAKTLDDGFKKIFGLTGYVLIADHRLNQGHIVVQDSDLCHEGLGKPVGAFTRLSRLFCSETQVRLSTPGSQRGC